MASTGPAAAGYWQSAAALCLTAEPAQSAELLRKAAAEDPTGPTIQADLARTTARIECWSEAEAAARSALELTDAEAALDRAARLDMALLGAQAAKRQERLEAAAAFYTMALDVEPDCADALAGAGECLAALEEWTRAREPLTARLAHAAANPAAAVPSSRE